MEKLAYQLKNCYGKIRSYFTSTKFLKRYDKTRKILKNIVPKLVMILILIVFSYIFLSPLLHVCIDSLKGKEDLVNPDVVWIPHTLTFNNFLDAGKALWLWRFNKSANVTISTLWNSFIFSLLSGIFQTVVSCMAGYAFARFSFKGKKLWFAGMILAFIIPVQLLIIPRQMMLRPLMTGTEKPSALFGLVADTQAANKVDSILAVLKTIPVLLLTLLGQGLNSSILIFISFSFFKMIPVALDEAAQIDGANFFQIFYHIILKMSIPTILVVFLFSFIWNWNDTYVLDNLTALSTDMLTFKSLPKALEQFTRTISQGSATSGTDAQNNAGLSSASILISIAPLIILYAFTQKKFVEGIENTGVTGV